MLEKLSAIFVDASDRLRIAAENRRSPMHTPVIATGDADARIMVLRALDVEQMTLRFHLDARSPKRQIIADDPRIGILAYDKEAGLQLRCRGSGRVETAGNTADAAWAASDRFARRCYLGDAPGELAQEPTSGLPEWLGGGRPTEEQLIPARKNFAILLVQLEEIDWYSLSHKGHRRALFRRADGWRGQWLAP